MAYSENLQTITLEAAADLSTKQYYFVKVNTSGKAAVSGDGENAVGVLQNDPAQDEPGTIGISGITKVLAGAAITTGAQVASSATGKAIAAASGDYILGTALETGADGRIISVLLQKNGTL